jgi:glutamate synthase domain-containing protein 1
MCGIVGLLVKNPALRSQLGALMVPMLVGMTERGPDSAGLAVYTAPVSDRQHKLSLYSGEQRRRLVRAAGAHSRRLRPCARDRHARQSGGADHRGRSGPARRLAGRHAPVIAVLSVGQSIDLYKDVGAPADIAERYGFKSLQGSHLVGHTRMATESAVTPAHAHPFTAGRDFCLVHNGSLSNPHLVRKQLEPLGIEFETDNDTEAACRFFEWRLREGDDLRPPCSAASANWTGFSRS